MSETKETLFEKIVDKVSVKLAGILQKEIKLEKAKLVDGTEVEIEDGNIYVLVPQDEGEPERLPAPVGEHELENGDVVVVEEEEVIANVKKANQEPEEMGKDKEMEFASKEEVAELRKDIDELKALMKPKEEVKAKAEEPKVDTKEEVKASKVEPKEEPKEKTKEVELSEPKKIKHSPEKKPKRNINLYAQKRQGTTKDRVYAKLFK